MGFAPQFPQRTSDVAPAKMPDTMGIFNRDGFYRFLVERNIACHREARNCCVERVAELISCQPTQTSYDVVDLASGGLPITIGEVLAEFPDLQFRYCGLDTNADQVALGTMFRFPKNVDARFSKQNAWVLANFPDASQDIVFSGLNLHHGTPEEIYALAKQVCRILKPGGIFISHDEYRPQDWPLIIRPETNPKDPSESFLMIPHEELSKFNPQHVALVGLTPEAAGEKDWRRYFTACMSAVLREHNAPEEGISQICTHIMDRDFSLTTVEVQHIFTQAGLPARIRDYMHTDAPLRAFYAGLTARKSA